MDYSHLERLQGDELKGSSSQVLVTHHFLVTFFCNILLFFFFLRSIRIVHPGMDTAAAKEALPSHTFIGGVLMFTLLN